MRVKGSNPNWTDQRGGGGAAQNVTKVKRYRAGFAPEWAKDEEESSEEEDEGGQVERRPAAPVIVARWGGASSTPA